MLLGDVVALDEDSLNAALRVAQRLVHEVDDKFAGREPYTLAERHGDPPAHVGLAGRVDAVQ